MTKCYLIFRIFLYYFRFTIFICCLGRKMTIREQRTVARLYTEQDSEYPSALQMYERLALSKQF